MQNTITLKDKILTANIIAKNRVNKAIKEQAPQIFAALKPFEGKKILLASGDLAAKVKDALAPFLGWKEGENLQIYKSNSGYSLSLAFKTSEHYSEFSVNYQESQVYFGDLKDGVLTKFYEFNEKDYCSDYSFEAIKEIQEELAAAEEKVNQIKVNLPAFAQR